MALWCCSTAVVIGAKLYNASMDNVDVGVPAIAWGWRAWLALPELALGLAGAAFSVAALGVSPPGLRRWIAVLVGLVAPVWASIELLSHIFFWATGSTVDFSLVRFVAAEFPVMFRTFAEGVPVAFVGIVAAWTVLLFYTWKAAGLAGRISVRQGVRVALGGLAAAVLSQVPLGLVENRGFERGVTSNLVWTAFELWRDPAPWSEVDPFATSAELLGQPQPRNVVIVVLESTGWRHTTLADPALDTTPYLAELAKTSVVVERAYTPYPHTLKAVVAIHCGIEPRLHTAQLEGLAGGVPARCLPQLLRARGYRTAFFQTVSHTFEHFDVLTTNLGFETSIFQEQLRADAGFVNYLGPAETELLAPSAQWLRGVGAAPFLATYVTTSPHHAYGLEEERGLLAIDPEAARAAHRSRLREQDAFVRDLVQQYIDAGRYDDTLFVIVGDHGEAFGEHGTRAHNDVLHEESIRVPMLVHTPWNPSAGVLPGPAWLPDLLPTIVARLGFDLDLHGAPISGVDIAAIPADRPLYATCFTERSCIARLQGRWKAIDYFGKRPPQLFDLVADPLEARNLAPQEPERLAAYLADARRWRQEVRRRFRVHDAWTLVPR